MTTASLSNVEHGFRRRKTVWLWSLALYGAWTVTWLVYQALAHGPWPALQKGAPEWGFWTSAKLLVWIAPVAAIARAWRVGSIGDWLGIVHTNRLGRGMVIAATWVSLCAAIDRLVPGRWPDGSPPDGGFAIAVVATLAAATFEEVLYRGFTLRALVESGLSFWRANAIAAGLFALLHVPGWLFMGWSPRQVATTMPSVILVGLACCVARMGNASLWASITVHVANNLWGGGIFLYGLYRVVSFVR